MSAFHRTFEVFEISCSQKEQNHSQRTRRITDNPSISTENNHLLEHPPSLTLDSAKKMESVTPDYRTPECGIRYLLLYAPISCYNWCVENRLWKSCYLKFWVYSMLTLITMIIIVHNSPFRSQTMPYNLRQLMTWHWVYLLTYLLTYLYFNPRSLYNYTGWYLYLGILVLQKYNNNRLKVLRENLWGIQKAQKGALIHCKKSRLDLFSYTRKV